MNELFESVAVQYRNLPVKILTTGKQENTVCFHPHWHDRIEIIYVEKGSLTATCANEKVKVHEKEAVFVHPRQPHTAISGEEGVLYRTIMFELKQWKEQAVPGEDIVYLILSRNIQFRKKIDNKKLTELLKRICEEYDAHLTGSAFVLKGMIYELIGGMLRYNRDESYVMTEVDGRFEEALNYINDHYTDALSTKGIAQKFSYDESYFCRKFRKRLGLSMVEYIRILRLETACMLLVGHKNSISQVAEQCGYLDVNYFIRCFRKRYGVTPAKFRKEKVAKDI